MDTKISEIALGVYRLSTWVAAVAPPAGFTFNQFLIDADEPMLFHCGHRQMFPLISAAVSSVMPLEKLRWISFGHVEADECGAMNLWLAAALISGNIWRCPQWNSMGSSASIRNWLKVKPAGGATSGVHVDRR